VRRTFARLGILTILGGTPLALGALVGSPAIPDFTGSDGLSGSFVPVESVLRLLGLLSWGLWVYLTFAIVLHGAATIAAIRHAPGQSVLIGVSTILTPKIVRSVVEFAIGSALVAGSVSVRASSALPGTSPPVVVEAGPIGSAAEQLDRAGSSSETPKETHRVRAGESLWRISERELGSGFRWREIYRLNEGKRFPDGRSLTDPRLLLPGWVLDLPSEIPPPAGRREGDGRADHAHEERVMQSRVSTTPDPIPTPGHASSPEEGSAESDPDFDADEAPRSAAPEPALEIPSGLLVAASFASGLLTAHLLGKLHRRRARRLSEASSSEAPITPDLIRDLRRAGASEMAGPIDVAVDAVIDAWRIYAASWPRLACAIEAGRHVSVFLRTSDGPLPGSSGGTISPRVRFARAGSTAVAEVDGPFPVQLRQPRTALERGLLVPIGRAPDGSVVHVSATGLGRISITGPESVRLMRQLVVAAATLGGPDDLRLVLLGSSDEMRSLRALPQASGYHDWEDAAEALREAELEFIRRGRLFLQEGARDVDDHLAAHADEQVPALLVVCEEPPAALEGVIAALAQQAPTFGAAVLTMGWQLLGAAMHARASSTVELESDLPLPRVLEPFLLDDSVARGVIQIIREAYPIDADEGRGLDEPDEAMPEAPAPTPVEVPSPGAAPQPLADPERALPPGERRSPPDEAMAIRCLGPFEISRRGESVPTGWRAKGRELIAYLVAHPVGAPKERVIEELWPDVEPARASLRFNKTAALIRAVARGRDDSRMYVERVGDSAYRLEEGSWWVDAWEFERLIHEAERREEGADAVNAFRDAVDLYRGEFCDDAYYPWLEGIRERFRNLFVEACGRLAYLLSEAGDHDQALSMLDRAIRADPVCEDLVRRAIALEATLGRRAAALARYRRLEATLDAELDVEPDPETQVLIERLLRPVERTG
jgi:DNA-binding SARP family transcriptional activator